MKLPVITSPIAGIPELENIDILTDWSVDNLKRILDEFDFKPNWKGEKEIRNMYNPRNCVNLLLEGIEKYGCIQ